MQDWFGIINAGRELPEGALRELRDAVINAGAQDYQSKLNNLFNFAEHVAKVIAMVQYE